MEYVGIEVLKNRLKMKRPRVNLRYMCYEQKHLARNMTGVIPAQYQWVMPALGWCAKTVDSIADRLDFRGFRKRTDGFDMNGIFAMNNPDVIYDSAALSALTTACCFIYISKGADEYPRLQVIDGMNATGIIDPLSNMLTEGYAILKEDKNKHPIMEAYFTREWTAYYDHGALVATVENPAPYPALVPIINRPDAKRPFGHSTITRSCISLMQSAARTIMRSEVSAEFYSFPQKYVTGLSQDTEELDRIKATISSFLSFSKDEDGDSPKLGQFQQQSMAPFMEQMKMLASAFAGETGLTMSDLGFETENPSSSDAIKASHENLRLKVRKAQKNFGSGFRNAGYIAACIRDDRAYERSAMLLTEPLWEPAFELDAGTLAGFGDAIIKINQAVPGYFGGENLRDITGFDPEGI